MKKEELIHTHALLTEIRQYINTVDETELEISEYDEMGVKPVHIHLGKGKHEDAVFALSRGLAGYQPPSLESVDPMVHAPAPADD